MFELRTLKCLLTRMVNSVLLLIQAAECTRLGRSLSTQGHRRHGKQLLLGPIALFQFQLLLQDCLHEQAHAKVSFTRQGVQQQSSL